MKKILILITILIMTIASCSSPTAIKNNGGGSDNNTNTDNKPPIEVPDGGDEEKPEVPTPKPDPEPEQPGGGSEEKPEVPTPEPEPQYKGLAKRLPQSIIGRKFVYKSYGDKGDIFQHYEVVFNANGSVNFTAYQGFALKYYNWNGSNPDMAEYTGTSSTKTGFENNINFNRQDTIRRFRVVFKKYDEGGDSSSQCMMVEFEFKNGNYNTVYISKSIYHLSGFDPSDKHDLDWAREARIE